jgi:PAS domain S-box-containing protein
MRMSEADQPGRAELMRRIELLETELDRARASAGPARGGGSASSDDERRLRAILDTAVEGIITIDARGLIETFNQAAERIFGYRTAEVIGRNVNMLMPSPYQEAHDGYLANYLQTGEARIIGIGREVVGLRKDGSVFPMDLSVSEVFLEDRRLFTGFVRDITERKHSEEKMAAMTQSLAEKNKELESIVYVASHDLRSPLVNIQGFSRELEHSCRRVGELLRDASVAGDRAAELETLIREDVPEALNYIRAGAAKIDTLLSGLLRFSRLGRAALRIERLDVNRVLAGILGAMEFQVQRAGARVRIEELPDCLGDAGQINQVFSNLLDNALKYLDPRRPGEITVSGRRENGRSLYAVRDNGRGIAAEHQARVFEIFHRLNPSQGEGEGLGLTIAQRSLERQNGRLWVESEAGVGSTFFVSLPAAGNLL